MGVPYVGGEAARLVTEWENKFQQLPAAAGVIFASVAAVPADGGACTTFEVRLGMANSFDEATGFSLIKHLLVEEIASGRYEIKVAVYRGVRCAGDSARPGRAHPYPA